MLQGSVLDNDKSLTKRLHLISARCLINRILHEVVRNFQMLIVAFLIFTLLVDLSQTDVTRALQMLDFEAVGIVGLE